MPPPFLREYWLPFHLNDEQIETLLTELIRRGLPVPGEIEALSGGNAGLSIIGDETVFKLIWKPRFYSYEKRASYVADGLDAYRTLDGIADEIRSRGVAVPRLLDGGHLTEPVKTGGPEFTGWQLMTRVAGQGVPRFHKSYRLGTPKYLSATMLPMLACAAARIHVQIKSGGKAQTVWQSLESSLAPLRRNGRRLRMLTQLRRDLDRLTGQRSDRTFLHGDFHALNILLDKQACVSVIDWDHLYPGQPEQDLAFMGLMPEKIRTLCALYNRNATRPVNETVVTAIAFAHMARRYRDMLPARHALRLKQRRELYHVAQRLIVLGRYLRQKTGKPVYGAYAETSAADS